MRPTGQCPATVTTRTGIWRCIRTWHAGDPDTSSPAVEDTRRRQGKTVAADRHWFRKVQPRRMAPSDA